MMMCRWEKGKGAGDKKRKIWLELVLTSLPILDIGVKCLVGHLFTKILTASAIFKEAIFGRFVGGVGL